MFRTHLIPLAVMGLYLCGVGCTSYDVKIVDEDGDECVMKGVDICGGSNRWVITSESLLACQAQ